jgi:hypothetical protein
LKDLLVLNNQNKLDGAAGGGLRKLNHFTRKASANISFRGDNPGSCGIPTMNNASFIGSF